MRGEERLEREDEALDFEPAFEAAAFEDFEGVEWEEDILAKRLARGCCSGG